MTLCKRQLIVYIPDDFTELSINLRWESETETSSGAFWFDVLRPKDEAERVVVGFNEDEDD